LLVVCVTKLLYVDAWNHLVQATSIKEANLKGTMQRRMILPVKDPTELIVSMLSDLRQGTEITVPAPRREYKHEESGC
jgi:hypothetical protein